MSVLVKPLELLVAAERAQKKSRQAGRVQGPLVVSSLAGLRPVIVWPVPVLVLSFDFLGR